MIPRLHHLIFVSRLTPPSIVMAFFPTARATGLAYDVFSKLNIGPTWEIHSSVSILWAWK